MICRIGDEDGSGRPTGVGGVTDRDEDATGRQLTLFAGLQVAGDNGYPCVALLEFWGHFMRPHALVLSRRAGHGHYNVTSLFGPPARGGAQRIRDGFPAPSLMQTGGYHVPSPAG